MEALQRNVHVAAITCSFVIGAAVTGSAPATKNSAEINLGVDGL